MDNMDYFVDMIHMAYRNLKYFHYCWGYIWGLGVDPYLIERPDASGVRVGFPPTTKGEQQDMIGGEWEKGNKTSLYMVEDTDLHHK
jgi:hypothetical protein